MNYIIKYGRNFMAISDRIEADCHRHWLLQMFLSSQKELSIEVNNQLIPCSAIIVNTNIMHTFKSDGESNFTMLVDPTTELGRMLKVLLVDQPFYVLPHDKTDVMQQAFNNALAQESYDAYLSFVQRLMYNFSNELTKSFDDRVIKVLRLLKDCAHEDGVHQIKYFSKKIGLSESRLAHVFKEETGIPLKSYIVLHKLQKTYDSIFNGENITTAALNAGFDSPSHFAYTNKLMTGMNATNIIRDSEFLKVF
ncbi:helix-turn-helix- domain containing protein, AraC type [Alkaliphilus metalliredigens QYMF]|uniref:Helix-turn-helix-domain containing protein, AraC type n=1 Tax=Alkaliphilus metalliredigens (strain QYMF) TaxID=293826 RepID=A6TV00_ALKMQ|nr:helix-turn-helix domain-containing protein [Alkaliphilus metalliredigens]ABR50018.1 helix-turn-helix- domain containing protein, AraC type [Alkaliphilus metalliredigens QYMF]